MRAIVAALRHLEEAVLGATWTEGLVLRYGAFYGPGTRASNEKAERELAWRPGAPELAAGTRSGMTP